MLGLGQPISRKRCTKKKYLAGVGAVTLSVAFISVELMHAVVQGVKGSPPYPPQFIPQSLEQPGPRLGVDLGGVLGLGAKPSRLGQLDLSSTTCSTSEWLVGRSFPQLQQSARNHDLPRTHPICSDL